MSAKLIPEVTVGQLNGASSKWRMASSSSEATLVESAETHMASGDSDEDVQNVRPGQKRALPSTRPSARQSTFSFQQPVPYPKVFANEDEFDLLERHCKRPAGYIHE